MLKDFEARGSAQAAPSSSVVAKKPPSCGAAADRFAKNAVTKLEKADARLSAANDALAAATKEVEEATKARAEAKEKADQAERTKKEYYVSVLSGGGLFADLVPPALQQNAALHEGVVALQRLMDGLLEKHLAERDAATALPEATAAEGAGANGDKPAEMEPAFADGWKEDDFAAIGEQVAGVDAAVAKRVLEAAAAHDKSKRAKTGSHS